jgi:predicted kinase
VTFEPDYPVSIAREYPDPALILPIGPAGAGKSTLACYWLGEAVLGLDFFRCLVSGRYGDQSATEDAVDVLNRALDARLKRRLTTYLDATNLRSDVRRDLVIRAHEHDMPAVAIMLLPPLDVCIARNAIRVDDRRVPDAEVARQHAAATAVVDHLAGEQFDHVDLRWADRTTHGETHQ